MYKIFLTVRYTVYMLNNVNLPVDSGIPDSVDISIKTRYTFICY